MTSRAKALVIAGAAYAKKGEDVLVLDVRKISALCDFFVIASAGSSRNIQAISDEIENTLKQKGLKVLRREGYSEARWVLLDCGSVIAHIFHSEARRFYHLEELWNKAKRVKVKRV